MNPSRCLIYLLAIAAGISPAAAAERNIVLIVADDQGQDAGCYGNSVIQTPNLDALAADGVMFSQAFATTASCSASRSVILTGLHNHRTGQYGHAHDYHHFQGYQDLKSLPVLLGKAGYRTATIGKFHVAPEQVYRFDQHLEANARNTVQMAERSKPFITADSAKPFFLYFCPTDPHRGGGQNKDEPTKPNRFGNRPEGYPGVEPIRYRPEDVVVPAFLPDSPATRAELAQYYQSVSRIDQGVGRLISILREAGVYQSTLIVYISDHGIAFPGAKTTTYEPGLRSPCIVRNPYLDRKGVVNQGMVSWVDITPTLLEFAGALAQAPGLHGRSFLPILDQESPPGWDEVFASHTFHEVTMYYPMRVIRGRQFKLIWNIAHGLPYPFASDLWAATTWQDRFRKGMQALYGKRTVQDYIHRPEFELYDLKSDPDEVRNLAYLPSHTRTLEELKKKLKAFQVRTEDPWILKWDYE
jgi:N-sulfoglucosamine sulfohydrolase